MLFLLYRIASVFELGFRGYWLLISSPCVFVRVELMDYLDSIDCSLEDFQAMLYGKQFGSDIDPLEVKPSLFLCLTHTKAPI